MVTPIYSYLTLLCFYIQGSDQYFWPQYHSGSLYTAYTPQWPQAFYISRGTFQRSANRASLLSWETKSDISMCSSRHLGQPGRSVMWAWLTLYMISLVLISSETLFICFHSTASSLYFSLISHLGIPDVKKSKASKPTLEWQDAGQRWVNVSGRAMKKETPKATGQTHISFWKWNSLHICIPFQAAKRTLCLPCRCSCQPFFYAASFSLMHRVKELLQAAQCICHGWAKAKQRHCSSPLSSLVYY